MATGLVDVADQVPVRRGSWQVVDGRATLTRRRWGPVRTAIAAVVAPWAAGWITITLDAMGTAAWEDMDGRSTQAVLDTLERRFPEEGRLKERFMALLQTLTQRGFLHFAANGDVAPSNLK